MRCLLLSSVLVLAVGGVVGGCTTSGKEVEKNKSEPSDDTLNSNGFPVFGIHLDAEQRHQMERIYEKTALKYQVALDQYRKEHPEETAAYDKAEQEYEDQGQILGMRAPGPETDEAWALLMKKRPEYPLQQQRFLTRLLEERWDSARKVLHEDQVVVYDKNVASVKKHTYSGWAIKVKPETEKLSEVLPPNAFVGEWKNMDLKTQGITRVSIVQAGDSWKLNEWGRGARHTADGGMEPCEFGPYEYKLSFLGDTCQDWLPKYGIAFRDHGFQESTVSLKIEDGHLVLETFGVFKDHSLRSNYRTRVVLERK